MIKRSVQKYRPYYYELQPIMLILLPAGTDLVMKALAPMILFSPITVSPPSIEAPAYMVTLSLIVGCRFLLDSVCPPLVDKAPMVTL